MFKTHLTIALVALPSEAEQYFAAAAAHLHPDSINLLALPALDDEEWKKANVIVIGDESRLAPREVRAVSEQAGLKQKIYYVAKSPNDFTEDDLAAIDAIWDSDMSAVLWQFRFKELLDAFWQKKELYYNKAVLQAIIDADPDLIWVKDIKGSHLKVNLSFCECVNKPRDDVEGRGHYYIWGLTEEMYKAGEYVCLETEEEVLKRGETCHFDEQVMMKGALHELSTYKSPVRDEDGEIIGTVGVAQDITNLVLQTRRIEELAYTDPLTGLHNRHSLFTVVNAMRFDERVTIISMDIDNLNLVNRNFGHEAGDAALKLVAETMRECFPEDVCVRLGGDEFVVAIIGEIELAALKNKLENFLDRLSGAFNADQKFDFLSVSVGIAWTDDPNEAIDTVLHQSDAALYRTKARHFYNGTKQREETPAHSLDELREYAASDYTIYAEWYGGI